MLTDPPTSGHSADELFKQAAMLHKQNSPAASALLQEILRIDPNHLGAIDLLAGIRFHSGDLAGVVPLLQRATVLRPTAFAFQSNLATAFAMLGRFDQAIAAFQAATALAPNSADTWLHLGLTLQQINRLDESQYALLKAVTLNPAHAPVLGVLGRSMLGAGKLAAARELCERTLLLNPNDHETRFALGCALHQLGQIDSAVAEYGRVVSAKPDYARAHFNLGKVAGDRKQHAAAIAHYRRVLDLEPNHIGAINNLALALGAVYQFDEAVTLLRQVVALQPGIADAHSNLGTALHHAGLYDEALQHLATAMKLNPSYASAEWNLAIIHLSRGELRDGFEAYEARLRLPREIPMLTFAQPLWDGASLSGRTILLQSEQGFGDVLHFIRYAPLLRESGATVLLLCPAPLHRLLRELPSVSAIFDRGEILPHFDVHCPLASLPLRFGTTLETIPNAVPYIDPNPALAETWKRRLDECVPGLRVGLVWAGSPEHLNDANRSLPLAVFDEIAKLDGITYISLQKGEAAKQKTPAGMRFVDLAGELTDFADTAALVSQLDLVISVDTAVAHLAGAMAKPTWVILPEPADWRWLLKRTDSPWYPTMRLFRQPVRGDWASPLRELADALRQFRS